jgi:hypothetical protein
MWIASVYCPLTSYQIKNNIKKEDRPENRCHDNALQRMTIEETYVLRSA